MLEIYCNLRTDGFTHKEIVAMKFYPSTLNKFYRYFYQKFHSSGCSLLCPSP